MKGNLTFSCQESAEMRHLLETHLVKIFVNDTINKYLLTDGCGSESQLLDCCPDHGLELPHIKMAYQIWATMEVADRHAVLGKFQCLFAALPLISPSNRKIFVFCALFVHEFATILAEAMEWPD